MRVGIYGGTFDPVHYGHLLLAECCREECRLDEVWFLPAAVPPHKQGEAISPAQQRIEMLKLAIGGHPAFVVADREVQRGGVSYTVDTLQEIQAEDSARELFFLMGADSLADLPTWKEPARICQLATLVVVRRLGSPEPDLTMLRPFLSPDRLEEVRLHQVQMPLMDLHSSEIRLRAAQGRSISYRVTRAVEKYIQASGLYRPESL